MLGIISLLFNFTVALNLPNVRLQTCRRKNRWNDLFKQVEKSSFSSTSILSFHHTFSASWKCSLSSFTQKILRLLCVPSGSLAPTKTIQKYITWHVWRPWPRVCDPMKASEVALVLVAQNAHHHPGQGWRQGEECHTQTAGGVMPSRFQDQGLEAVTRLGRDPSLRWLAQPGWLSSIFLGWFLDGCCKHPFWNDKKWIRDLGLTYYWLPKPWMKNGHFGLRDFLPSLVYKWHFTELVAKVHCFWLNKW